MPTKSQHLPRPPSVVFPLSASWEALRSASRVDLALAAARFVDAGFPQHGPERDALLVARVQARTYGGVP